MSESRARAKTLTYAKCEYYFKKYLQDQAVFNGLEEKRQAEYEADIEKVTVNFSQQGGFTMTLSDAKFAQVTVTTLAGHQSRAVGTAVTFPEVTKEAFVTHFASIREDYKKIKRMLKAELEQIKANCKPKQLALQALHTTIYMENKSLQPSPAKRWNVKKPIMWARTRKTVAKMHQEFKKSEYNYWQQDEEGSPRKQTLKQLRERLKSAKEKLDVINQDHLALSAIIHEAQQKKGYAELVTAFTESKENKIVRSRVNSL